MEKNLLKMRAFQDNEKVIVLLDSNRIGQGIEFDYSCVHGVLASKESGYETIMIKL